MTTNSQEEMESQEGTDNFDKEPGGGFELRKRQVVECAKETIENAQRLIKRKIPCAGHLLAPRRLWLRRVATPNCDVVLVFSPNAKDSVLMWLLARLRQSAGLTVHVRHHASTQSSAFYVSAPFPVLLKAAEEYHLPKTLHSTRGGGLKEFVIQESQCFENVDDEKLFFTTQERQWLILKLLEGLRARASDKEAIPNQTLLDGQLIIPKCISAGIISQMFPLHDPPELEKLQISWVRDIFAMQPLDQISTYFGVKIGMYFAWLGHYTAALGVPAIVGTLFWLCCDGRNQTMEDIGYVLFSFFNVVWVSVYLQAWKRYSAELAFRWGTLDQRADLLAEPRPLFNGDLEISPVTGRLEPHYPAWKRHAFRYCVSVPIIAFCLVCVFAVMIASLQIQDWWDQQLEARSFPIWLGYVPKVMLAVVISLMDEAYFKIAVWLNDKENYRLETKYENHLIGKVALFQFINSFLSLFYIAFYLQDQARLKEQLAALLIARQVIGNLKESALPYLLEQMRLAKLSFDLWGALSPTGNKPPPGVDQDPQEAEKVKEEEDKNGQSTTEQASAKRTISQAELESSLFKYDGTFADHLEMMIQIGYVVLFSSAFPPAALCAILNNLIEIRSDAFKLGYVCQRPFGQRVPNIGTWLNCIEYMGYMAVIVNCALIGLSGQVHRMFPDMTATQTILLIVVLEHIMLCIRFVITCAIPELPNWLATEMAKVEFARREAGRVNKTASPSPSEDTKEQMIGRFSVSASPSHLGNASSISDSKVSEVHHEAQVTHIEPKTSSTPTSPGVIQTKHKPITISADSIQQIPPFRPKSKSRDWQTHEGSEHHLTIGPSGAVEWAKKLKDDGDIHHSAECITSKDASSSDSDLHKNTPMWPPLPRNSNPSTSAGARIRANLSAASAAHSTVSASHQAINTSHQSNSNQQSIHSNSSHHGNNSHHSNGNHQTNNSHHATVSSHPSNNSTHQSISSSHQSTSSASDTKELSDSSSKTVSSQEDEAAAAQRAAEELAAKKTRVKQSLIKRARSVAIFSLKLKERRAREAEKQAKAEKSPTQVLPPPQLGGEMSCIPIEKLIQLEDVRRNLEQGGTLPSARGSSEHINVHKNDHQPLTPWSSSHRL